MAHFDHYNLVTLFHVPLHQMTPLHMAAESGHIEIVEHFIGLNVDVNITDHKGVNICDSTNDSTM